MNTLTSFEKCKAIRHSLLTRVGESMTYNWSDDFKYINIINIHRDIKRWEEREKVSYKVDLQDLTDKEMDDLGFGRWSKESNLRLIPIWLLPFLSDEIQIEDINGAKCMKSSEIDNDHRFGYLAYGVVPKDSTVEN